MSIYYKLYQWIKLLLKVLTLKKCL